MTPAQQIDALAAKLDHRGRELAEKLNRAASILVVHGLISDRERCRIFNKLKRKLAAMAKHPNQSQL